EAERERERERELVCPQPNSSICKRKGNCNCVSLVCVCLCVCVCVCGRTCFSLIFQAVAMYGSPLLPILTSSKKASSSDQQAAELLAVDDLLDNPWHYDCVVSPRLISSDLAPKSPVFLSKRSAPAAYSRPLSPPLSGRKPSANPPLTPPPLSKSSANRRPLSPLSLARSPTNYPSSTLSKPAACNPSSSSSSSIPINRILITQASSNYVSLASFINNGDKSSYGSSTAATLDFSSKRSSKSITPVLSKCREREAKTHIRGDPSRIRSYSGCLAVD
ncbi:hypothetical protein GOP47_0030435, partial [Adiantum capillus-veneris]